MDVVERGVVEHKWLRGHDGRHFGIASRRRIDGERVGTEAR